jgi:hypothetical protein
VLTKEKKNSFQLKRVALLLSTRKIEEFFFPVLTKIVHGAVKDPNNEICLGCTLC